MYTNLEATNAVRQHSTATGSGRAVLMVLAFHADADGWTCDPSRETLADEAGLSVPTVKRALRALEELGEIEIEHRPVPGCKHDTNVYRLKLPREEQEVPVRHLQPVEAKPQKRTYEFERLVDRVTKPKPERQESIDDFEAWIKEQQKKTVAVSY